MIQLHFSNSNKDIQMNYSLLKIFVQNIPDNPYYNDVISEMLQLDIASLNEILAVRDTLTMTQRDNLWDTKDASVRVVLLHNASFVEQLSPKQALQIISSHERDLLCALASNAHYLERAARQEENFQKRISASRVTLLLMQLASHDDACVQEALLSNAKLEQNYFELSPLSLHDVLKKGVSGTILRRYLTQMSASDVQELPYYSRKALLHLVKYIGYLQDGSILYNAVSLFLQEYPDPEIRIAYARQQHDDSKRISTSNLV